MLIFSYKQPNNWTQGAENDSIIWLEEKHVMIGDDLWSQVNWELKLSFLLFCQNTVCYVSLWFLDMLEFNDL